jgi:biopolymer transport protein TolR
LKRKVREEEEMGELNIVPYLDIVTNLLMFMLLSMAGLITLGVLDVGTPKLGAPDSASASASPGDKPKEELNLTVAVTNRGFFVAGSGGVIGGKTSDGSMDTQKEPTVPRKNGQYDYDGLTNKMAEVKTLFPQENRVILLAEMDIPYDVVISTMDACRERVVKKDGAPERLALFGEVWLSMLH